MKKMILALAFLSFVWTSIGWTAEPEEPASIAENLEALDGIEAKCAKEIGGSMIDAVPTDSFAGMAKMLSVSGAADTLSVVVDAVQAELHSCIVEVYMLGIEQGRAIEQMED